MARNQDTCWEGWTARKEDTCSLWIQTPSKRLLLPPEGDSRKATSNLVLRGSSGISWTDVCFLGGRGTGEELLPWLL